MFGCVGLPPSAFTELEPRVREDGKVLRRFLIKGLEELGVYEEEPWDRLPPLQEVVRKRFAMPDTSPSAREARHALMALEDQRLFDALDELGR